MSDRRFVDGAGRRWEIRIHAKGDWEFRPVPGNPEPVHRGPAPLYASDPFELSEEELRQILADAAPRASRPAGGAPSPFKDDAAAAGSPGGGLFGERERQKKRSPFLDDRD